MTSFRERQRQRRKAKAAASQRQQDWNGDFGPKPVDVGARDTASRFFHVEPSAAVATSFKEYQHIRKHGHAPLKVSKTEVGRIDTLLLVTTIALSLFGLLAVYTASASTAVDTTGNSFYFVSRQAISMIIGVVGMLIISRINFQRWKKVTFWGTAITIALLIITLLFGKVANGSERWISLPGGLQFQPSEFAKLSTVLLIASYAAGKNSFLRLIGHLLPIAIMILLVMKQPNLSLAIILASVTGAMLLITGIPVWILGTCVTGGMTYVVHHIQKTPYLMRRILGWLNPWADPMDTGYNIIQSYYAIGSGGIFGRGLGHSIQKLYYLPFQHTDFIFAVICEELGLLGSFAVLGLFMMLGWRGMSIALTCPSPFGQQLAFGITAALLIQTIINLSVTTGIFPVTGVTLPLISFGGTSMILTLCMLGILMNISRYRLILPTNEEEDELFPFDSELASAPAP